MARWLNVLTRSLSAASSATRAEPLGPISAATAALEDRLRIGRRSRRQSGLSRVLPAGLRAHRDHVDLDDVALLPDHVDELREAELSLELGEPRLKRAELGLE